MHQKINARREGDFFRLQVDKFAQTVMDLPLAERGQHFTSTERVNNFPAQVLKMDTAAKQAYYVAVVLGL